MTKVLIIQNKRIGDVLLASVIAENIKKVHPKSTVDFLVYNYTTGVIENNPNIDNIIAINEKELKKLPNLFKLIFKLKKHKYDILFDPYAKLQSRLISLFSGIPMRIGYKKSSKNPVLPFYTHNTKFIEKSTLSCGRSLEDRVNMVTSHFKVDQPIYAPKITLTSKEQEYDKLNHLDKPVVMFGILGSTASKSMPKEYVIELVDDVIETFNVYALFNYAPYQKDDAKYIYTNCKNKNRILFDIYAESIRDFAVLMNKCTALIANEGGSVHIAKALNKPTFTIYSPFILKEYWASFEDSPLHDSIHILEEKPNLYKAEKEDRKRIEKNPEILYKALTPELIKPKLHRFLETNLR